MKTVSDAVTFVTEDGEHFLTEVEAVTHESLLYIGKTIAAFGGGQVAQAIKAVELRHPQICAALFHLAKHLQGVQSLLPAGNTTPKIDSVNAPANVAASPDLVPGQSGILSGNSEVPPLTGTEPNETGTGQPAASVAFEAAPASHAPADPAPPVSPPSPDLPTPTGDQERVTKPDETPREPPTPADVPSQIYPGDGRTVGQMIDEQNKGLPADPTDNSVPGSKLEAAPAAA